MWGCVWLPGKLFSPIDGMKNFITFSKLLAISSAHHSVTGFMLPKHLLHCICYFSNGASKIQKQSINAIRRLIWKQNIEVTGRGPTICLAAGQIQLHLFPLWCYNSEHLTHPSHPLIKRAEVFLRKYCFADVRSDFTSDKAIGTIAWQNISGN